MRIAKKVMEAPLGNIIDISYKLLQSTVHLTNKPKLIHLVFSIVSYSLVHVLCEENSWLYMYQGVDKISKTTTPFH